MNQTKTPHPHAAMFKEWIDDTSRNIEYRVRGDEIWASYTDDIYDEIERFDPVCNWRFSDTVPKAPVIKSGLTDDDIRSIFRSHEYPNNTAEMVDDLRGCRAIAHAAAQEIVTRIMGLDAVMRLDDEVSGEWYSRIKVIDFMNYAIKHFLASLPELLKEPK